MAVIKNGRFIFLYTTITVREFGYLRSILRICIILIEYWNLSSAIIQVGWTFFSITGIINIYRKNRVISKNNKNNTLLLEKKVI